MGVHLPAKQSKGGTTQMTLNITLGRPAHTRPPLPPVVKTLGAIRCREASSGLASHGHEGKGGGRA